jgi:hypothetical protein
MQQAAHTLSASSPFGQLKQQINKTEGSTEHKVALRSKTNSNIGKENSLLPKGLLLQ